MSTFKKISITDGIEGPLNIEDKIKGGFVDVFDTSLCLKEIPVTKISNYVGTDFYAYQVGRFLVGYISYFWNTPDFTELARINYSDLYKYTRAYKFHHVGIWINPIDEYISISSNFMHTDTTALCSFYTILY